MKKFFLFSFFSFISFSFSFGQGIIRGKVTDKNGETLIGVSIVLKSNHTVGAVTDLDGNYSLKIADSTAQTIVVSYISYQAKEETVHPVKGEVIIKNFILESASQQMKEVEIISKAIRANDNYMEKMKMNTSSTIDYVSSETMKKTGDVNVVAAVARVSGVSTNGGFITVRGIGDRYVKTTINGSRIPTLDPFTNNIKLDMFPASLVDNVIITKTASPDLPGDWAGAYISVETKDYPEKLSVNVETSFGYNNQTSFKDVVSTQRSSTDWLGYDDGFRDHNHNSFVPTNTSPQPYEEFVALGLGDYFKSIGVTKNWLSTDQGAETYFKLGLVQLGLLGKDQMNDAGAFTAAKNKYDHGSYHAIAFDRINAKAIAANKSFPNNWRTTVRRAPLNYSQSFSIGNQVNLFGRPLGFLAGFRYSSAIQYDPNSGYSRINSNMTVKGIPTDVDTAYLRSSKETNAWSALLNLAYKYHPNHSISLLFMPNVSGVNNASFGTIAGNSQSYKEKQFYESRKQLVYQLKSEHYIPSLKMKIEGNASYTNGNSVAPDFKVTNVPIDTAHQNGPVISGARFFRYLKENIFDSRLSAEIPLTSDPVIYGIRKLKFGGGFQRVDRKSDQYAYNFDNGLGANQITAGNESSDPYSLDKFEITPVILNGIPTHSVLRYYQLNDLPNNHSVGYSNLTAGYAMLDYTIIPKLRASGGFRVEGAFIHTDVKLYDSLNLAYNDPRRHTDQFLINNPGKLDELSFLPSINLIYKIRNDISVPINLRFNFSQTVARPSIRELSDISIYDYELNDNVTGNPDLKMTHINNYDMRLEWYFKSGDNVSMSLFYKDFKNHIELVNFPPYGYYWLNNTNKAWLTGIELEGKKRLSKHFEFRANITLVDSRSAFPARYSFSNGPSVGNGETVTHTMFGQAPYVINSIISYNSDSMGLTVALSYNMQGPRLVIDGTNGIPDVYELPRNLVDMKVSKKLGKYFTVSLKVNDIFNAPIVRSYKLPAGYTLDYDRYRYGTNYILGVTYKL